MTNLKIRNSLFSDLELFLIKGASCEENETCLQEGFLYAGTFCVQCCTLPYFSKMSITA